MKTAVLIATLAFGLQAAPATAQDSAGIMGEWRTAGGWATVRISRCVRQTERICGNIVALRRANDANGRPLLDRSNPDAALRSRPLVGLPFITGFRPAGNNRWTGGRIYDPDSGRTYGSNMQLQADGTLKVNGCVLVICQAQTWTRAPR